MACQKQSSRCLSEKGCPGSPHSSKMPTILESFLVAWSARPCSHGKQSRQLEVSFFYIRQSRLSLSRTMKKKRCHRLFLLKLVMVLRHIPRWATTTNQSETDWAEILCCGCHNWNIQSPSRNTSCQHHRVFQHPWSKVWRQGDCVSLSTIDQDGFSTLVLRCGGVGRFWQIRSRSNCIMISSPLLLHS